MRAQLILVCAIVFCESKAQSQFFSPRSSNFDDLLEEKRKDPVPILRYVDRQNSDGSYTYGFENGDGTYKIETRYATGEVKGKYGYYDPSGELREVEYGAKPNRGFEPRAKGLVVPPPTIPDPNEIEDSNVHSPQQTDHQEEPLQQEPVQRNKFDNFRQRGQEEVLVVRRRRPAAEQPQRRVRPASEQPQNRARPAVRPVVSQPLLRSQSLTPAPVRVDPAAFQGHPARNIDLNKGTYSFSYSG